MQVKLTNVFHRTGQALLNAVSGTGPRLIINQGGQGSSKTFSTLQVIYNYLLNAPPTKTTFCSYALPHLKQGVISDFDNILASFGENPGLIKSSPAQPVYHIGKSEINCYGVEGNLAMAHGPRRGILFINECNRKITYEVFDQLFSRSQITFLDFNPDQEFWLHEKILPNFPHVLIKSNYLDNPYLPENERKNIELKKDKPGFENWWKVYGMGELGRLEGTILPNWRYFQEGEQWPKDIITGYGLDFGFNDPDALVRVAIDKKRKIIYLKQCIYKSGNSAEQLKLLMTYYITGPDLIVADAADARMISTLQKNFNIRPANKQKWTVAEALKMMQDYEIVITEDSYDLAKELNNYIWNDKKAGIPIDNFNHCFVGNTQVLTSGGFKKIKDIDIGDVVINSSGGYKIVNKYNNGIQPTKIYLIQIGTIFAFIQCTDNHLIKTTTGWTQISQLKSGQVIFLNKNLIKKHTGFILGKDTSVGDLAGCIKLYGSFTMAKYPKVFQFTILIKIHGIIKYQILKYCLNTFIVRITGEKELITKNGLINSIQKVLSKLRNGINQKRDMTGTSSTELTLGQNGSSEYAVVNFVERNTKQKAEEEAGFVPVTVRRVFCVGQTEARVYDLMVEYEHEYSSNGILVHNCIDASRYFFQQMQIPEFYVS